MGDLGDVLIDECFETLVSGDVFQDGWQLLSRNIFRDVSPVFAVLEIVVWLAVRTGADDGEVAAFHGSDGGHLFDTFW